MPKITAKIIIPPDTKPYPETHELFMASILVNHFDKNVTFIPPKNTYGIKTPDIILNNLEWEMKAPKTNKMQTVVGNVEDAVKQSLNIVISAHRSKSKSVQIYRYLLKFAKTNKNVQRIIFVNSDLKVLTIL